MSRSKTGKLIMGLGLLLIAAALVLSAYNVWDSYRAGRSAEDVLAAMDEAHLAALTGGASSSGGSSGGDKDGNTSAGSEQGNADGADGSGGASEDEAKDGKNSDGSTYMPTINIDGNEYIGVLDIPALGIRLPVMGDWSYPKLRTAPCRYIGSVYDDDLVICGHNYQRHFGGLKNLTAGDTVMFTDEGGNVSSYTVTEVVQLSGTALGEMKAGDWDLTLFTCTVGGQLRVTVRCMRSERLYNEQGTGQAY